MSYDRSLPVCHGTDVAAPSPHTAFRLLVTDVAGHEAAGLQEGLRSLEAVDWHQLRYLAEPELMVADGCFPCRDDQVVRRYLRELTYRAWERLGGGSERQRRGWYPVVWLYLHPGTQEQVCYGLDARHYGQFKRRRREREIRGEQRPAGSVNHEEREPVTTAWGPS